jgi:KilA domain-containing protein
MTSGIVYFNAKPIEIRNDYMNATALCQANGKDFSDWRGNKGTTEFLAELTFTAGIPADRLVISREGRHGGTWVHRRVWYQLGQWCNAKCAVWVSGLLEQYHEEFTRAAFGEPVPLDQLSLLDRPARTDDADDDGTPAVLEDDPPVVRLPPLAAAAAGDITALREADRWLHAEGGWGPMWTDDSSLEAKLLTKLAHDVAELIKTVNEKLSLGTTAALDQIGLDVLDLATAHRFDRGRIADIHEKVSQLTEHFHINGPELAREAQDIIANVAERRHIQPTTCICHIRRQASRKQTYYMPCPVHEPSLPESQGWGR